MGALRVLGAAGAVVLAVLAGCGGGASVNHAPTSSPCEVRLAPTGQPADTITVALFEPVDLAHAPVGQNRGERFVFGHLYETLIAIDCHGEIRPGLASSWSERDNGESWVFELRDDARFWDGAQVTASDVAKSFRDATARGGAVSAHVIDQRHVKVYLLEIQRLSLPAFAVTKATEPSRPAIGTGPWCVDASNLDTTVTAVIRPSLGANGPVVRFVEESIGDARDLLDGAVDAMVTDDPAVIEYVATRPQTTNLPLWWDRAYVLLSTSRVLALSNGERVENIPQSLCDALALDAVRAEARGGSSLIEDSRALCDPWLHTNPDVPPDFKSGDRRVLYDVGDPTARDLAERLVALAAMDSSKSAQARAVATALPGAMGGNSAVRAVGLSRAEIEASLLRGKDFAYVLALPGCAENRCVALHLVTRASWLLAGYEPSRTIMPLVETRARLIVANDRVGIIDDGQGGVRIMNPAAEPTR